MTTVRARAHTHADRAGDPLDGLVNLFDVAIVLAVAFLLVALTAIKSGTPNSGAPTVVVPSGSPQVTPGPSPAAGRGSKVGSVYRLQDGTLVYVPGR